MFTWVDSLKSPSILLIAFSLFVTFLSVLLGSVFQSAHGDCILDEDWPDRPCLDTPPYTEEYLKQVWQQYYEYKGREWMEMKKSEMDRAIDNGTLREWVETRTAPNNFANNNVWKYYYMNNQAPDAYPGSETVEPIALTALSVGSLSEATYEAKISWVLSDIGQPNRFHVEIFDANQPEPRSPLAVSYDIRIYKDDKYLVPDWESRNDDYSVDYAFTFPQDGSYTLAIEDIDRKEENIEIPIQVTPEFPIGLFVVVAGLLAFIIATTRISLIGSRLS